MNDKESIKKESVKEIGFQEEIYRQFGESKLKPGQYSALGLAYIGDAVYDLIIRTLVLRKGNYSVKAFHKMTSSIVKAHTQALMAEALMEELTEEEHDVYRRGRNAKSFTTAKNATVADYRKATGFEALMGYLYLEDRFDRAVYLSRRALDLLGIEP